MMAEPPPDTPSPDDSPLAPSRVGDAALVAQRRQHLVATASRLFLRSGFHQTSVREIAEAAGFTMGTLYGYISKKEDVLYLIAESTMAQHWDQIRQSPRADTTKQTLQNLIERYFDIINESRPQVKLLYRESATMRGGQLQAIMDFELKIASHFADVVKEGIKSGEFATVIPEVYAFNCIALAHWWALKGWALASIVSYEQYREQQVALLLRDLEHSSS